MIPRRFMAGRTTARGEGCDGHTGGTGDTGHSGCTDCSGGTGCSAGTGAVPADRTGHPPTAGTDGVPADRTGSVPPPAGPAPAARPRARR